MTELGNIPFKSGPTPDPSADEKGIIWASPHSHEVSATAALSAVSEAIAARCRGDNSDRHIFEATWRHLTHRQFISSLLTLTSQKLDELVRRINLTLVATTNQMIPAWAAALIPEEGVATGLPDDVLADACVSNYRTLPPEALQMVLRDPILMKGYDQALLGTALLTAYRDEDHFALDGLLQQHTQPVEVRESVLQIFDYLVGEMDDAVRS